MLVSLGYSFSVGLAVTWHSRYRLGHSNNTAADVPKNNKDGSGSSAAAGNAQVQGCCHDDDDDKNDDKSVSDCKNQMQRESPSSAPNNGSRVCTTMASAAVVLERAYRKTNNYPLIDGLLEIPFSFRFLSWRDWWVPVIAWAVFFILVTNLAVNLALLKEPPGVLTSCALASIQGYRFTADVCEYWVYTHFHRYHDDDSSSSSSSVAKQQHLQQNVMGVSGGDLTQNTDDSSVTTFDQEQSDSRLSSRQGRSSNNMQLQQDRLDRLEVSGHCKSDPEDDDDEKQRHDENDEELGLTELEYHAPAIVHGDCRGGENGVPEGIFFL